MSVFGKRDFVPAMGKFGTMLSRKGRERWNNFRGSNQYDKGAT